MKNRIVAVLICFVLMFSVVSCDDQEKNVGYGSLSVEISNDDGSKTISPTDENLAFVSYIIKGRNGANEDWIVNESFSSKNIKIDHLEVGNWEFVVEGFNKDDVLLAKSEPHIVTIRTNGNAKETYTLDWIEGFGSLKLSVKVQTSRVSSMECQLYDGNGNVVENPYTMEKENSVLQDDGSYLFEKVFHEVPTGFYNAKIVMKDNGGEPLGKTLNQSVHIHDGLESSFGFTWKGFPNLLPQVDVPKTNFGDGTSIPCNSRILFTTEEEYTSISYSFDGKSYSVYTENGIDLSQMQDLSDSIKIWVYAEKANMNKSGVAEYTFNVEHSPDRANAEYKWNAIEGGYECVATSKCLYHQSLKCETDKIVASYKVITDSTCSREGVGRYTAKFAKDGYKAQTMDETIVRRMHTYTKIEKKTPTCTEAGMYECVCSVCSYETFEEISALGHDKVHHEAKAATCTEIGWYGYDTCTRCEYTTYDEIEALGHNYLLRRVDDEYHGQVCSRCGTTVNKVIHSFIDYKCTECGTWGRGPSGGYVFYDRGEYTGGERSWRYLEAAPADLRLVDGVPTVDSAKAGYLNGNEYFIFGYHRETSGGSNVLLSTKTGIGEGYSNTKILVDKMKDAAYLSSSGTETTSDYAARLCHELGWFLPSKDELDLMYENLHKQGLGSFADFYYWSSSEGRADLAWGQRFGSGFRLDSYRYYAYRVRPVRAF